MDQLPLIVIPGLEGNEPAALTELQAILLPFMSSIEMALWALWVGTLAFLFVRYVLIPLVKKLHQ